MEVLAAVGILVCLSLLVVWTSRRWGPPRLYVRGAAALWLVAAILIVRVIYVGVTENQRDGLSTRERARLQAIKPLVQATMDKAALERTLAAGQKLVDAERQHDDEMLASARAAFPELRRRASGGLPPVLSVSPAHVAEEGSRSTGAASLPAAPRRAGWYSRRNGSPVVKDAGRSRAPFWQGYVPPDRPTSPTPFPAGLNVGD